MLSPLRKIDSEGLHPIKLSEFDEYTAKNYFSRYAHCLKKVTIHCKSLVNHFHTLLCHLPLIVA